MQVFSDCKRLLRVQIGVVNKDHIRNLIRKTNIQNPPPIGRVTLAYRWNTFRRPLRWSSFGAVAFGLPLNKETLLGGFYSERLFDTTGMAFHSDMALSSAMAV